MGAQSQINSLIGQTIGAVTTATKGIKQNDIEIKANSKDMQMAAKARKQYKDKINALYANKEISNKARARRLNKIIDEYQGGGK